MQREMYMSKIQERIEQSEPGSIFVVSDFKDIADPTAIKKALSRLCEDNIIRRILRGIYEYPEYSSLLQEYVAPAPNKVAQALARNFGWTIIPSDDTALNMLGLSTQVPNEWSYVSDGPYKSYGFDHTNIKFKHITNKEITGISYKSALIIQALKTLGISKINNKDLLKLSKSLTPDEKTKLLSESQYATSWIYESIKEITKGGGADA